jgi:hypothetical protein
LKAARPRTVGFLFIPAFLTLSPEESRVSWNYDASFSTKHRTVSASPEEALTVLLV